MKKRVRKPKGIQFSSAVGGSFASVVGHPTIGYPRAAFVSALSINSKDCRKLAAWLIKAADYLEAKEK